MHFLDRKGFKALTATLLVCSLILASSSGFAQSMWRKPKSSDPSYLVLQLKTKYQDGGTVSVEFVGPISDSDLEFNFDRTTYPNVGVEPLQYKADDLIFKTKWENDRCVIKSAELSYAKKSRKVDFNGNSLGSAYAAGAAMSATIPTDIILSVLSLGIYPLAFGTFGEMLTQKANRVIKNTKKFRRDRELFSMLQEFNDEKNCSNKFLRNLTKIYISVFKS